MKQPSAVDVTEETIRFTVRDLGLAGRPVCIHSSLSNFGHVAGGASTVVDAFLGEQCTLMVPTYSYWAWTSAPEDQGLRPDRNAYDYTEYRAPATTPYSTESKEVSPEMGAVAAELCSRTGRLRGANPGVSFSAIGPLAKDLIESQTARDPDAPFRALGALGGYVVLAGVGLERMSLIHAAEKLSGRVPFMRYALTAKGIVPFATGGCSEGFGNLAAALEPLRREAPMGMSKWQVYPAGDVLEGAAAAIKNQPSITHCKDQSCARCDAAIAGGPIGAWER